MFENWLNTPEEKSPEKYIENVVRRPERLAKQKKPSVPSFTFSRPHAVYAMALAVFMIGLYVSFAGARTNNVAEAQIKKLSQQAQTSNSNSNAPDTTKPTPAQISSYSVAADFPRYIDIPFIGVHSRVMQTLTKSDGSLGAPANVYDTAWYTDSSKPGQPGAMLIDGHISSWTTKGVFYNLDKLVKGNTISITRGDGKTFDYSIVKSETVDAKKVNMADLLVSQDTAKPGLNLISCSGDVIPGTNEFNKRIIVYAVLN
jgi:LPXTG-site transpeptidase (sortase) family protein